MASFTFDLPEGLPVDVAREVAKRACYCDRGIVGCSYDPDRHELVVRHELSDHANLRLLWTSCSIARRSDRSMNERADI